MYGSNIKEYSDLLNLARRTDSCASEICSNTQKVIGLSQYVEQDALQERRRAESKLAEWQKRLSEEEEKLRDLVERMNNADEDERDFYRGEVDEQQSIVNRLRAKVERLTGVVQTIASIAEHIRVQCATIRNEQQSFCSSFSGTTQIVSDGIRHFCHDMQAEDERFRRRIQSIGL